MTSNPSVVDLVLNIIKENPGLTYKEINGQVKSKKLKTNQAFLNILISDLILTNRIRRTNTSPKKLLSDN